MRYLGMSILVILVICGVAFWPFPLSSAATSLSSYEASFEVVPNVQNELEDVRVELRISYHIQGEKKSGGMKLVEARHIEEVEVTDEKGRALAFRLSSCGERYTRISWSFPDVEGEIKQIVVRFVIPDAITREGEKSYFRAYWVGGWKVPVEKAVYRFTFPPGYRYQELSVYPQSEVKERVVSERKQVEVSFSPLKGESFAIAFSPHFSIEEKTMKQATQVEGRTFERKDIQEKESKGDLLEEQFPKKAELGVEDSHGGIDPHPATAPTVPVEEAPWEDKGIRETGEVSGGQGGEGEIRDEREETGEELMEEVREKEGRGEVFSVSVPFKGDKFSSGGRGMLKPSSPEEERIYESALELFQQGRYEEALATFRYFMSLYPRSLLAEPVAFFIGDCYFQLAREGTFKSYQPAIDAFQLALALYPDSKHVPQAIFYLASSCREMKYHYEADAYYRQLIENYPDTLFSSDAYFWMGENLFQEGEFDKARDQLQEFLRKYPQADQLKLKQASFRIGDCYVENKDYVRARKSYEEALAKWTTYDGLFPETLFNMGLTYLEDGEYGTARSLLFMVFNVFADQELNHIVLTRIGDAYRKEGKIEEALKVYAQACTLFPGSRGALISEMKMADIGVRNPGFFNFEQYLDPMKVYQRIINKYPASGLAEEALFGQGFALSEQRRYEDAISSLLKVLDEYPESALSKRCLVSLQETLCKLIESYFKEEKYAAIIELYQTYKEPYLAGVKQTSTLFQVGESFRQIGLYDEALEMYSSAQRIYPRTHPEDELLLRMGEIYMLKGAYDEAQALFDRLIQSFPESRCRKIALHNLADAYYEHKDYERARVTYLSALEGGEMIPRDIRGMFYLGKCYQALGNSSLSIETFQKVMQVATQQGVNQGENAYVIASYFQLADALYQSQQYHDAIDIYKKAVERYPEDERSSWALYRIAESFRKVGGEVSEMESLKNLVSGGSGDPFWEKVIGSHISNLEWERKNREYLVP